MKRSFSLYPPFGALLVLSVGVGLVSGPGRVDRFGRARVGRVGRLLRGAR